MALLTMQEVANRLKVSVWTVRRYIRDGKLKAIKLNRGLRVREEDLERFLQEREITE